MVSASVPCVKVSREPELVRVQLFGAIEPKPLTYTGRYPGGTGRTAGGSLTTGFAVAGRAGFGAVLTDLGRVTGFAGGAGLAAGCAAGDV